MTEHFELMCAEMVIRNELSRKCTQKRIADTYGLALASSWPTDWKKINQMIIERWSPAGLERVKKMAWAKLKTITRDT